MTKILIDEAVVRQALEALEDYEYAKETTAYLAKVERATADIRQALGQPAPAQPWNGLADGDFVELCDTDLGTAALIRKVEAKLKEKNT
jgi:hypothetical protein